MMQEEADKNYDLIIRFLMGNTLPEEEKSLLAWKNANSDNKSYFNKLRDIWFATSQVKQPASFDENAALAILHKKIILRPTVEKNSKVQKHRFLQYLRVAAILIAVFSLGGITTLLTKNKMFLGPQIVKIVTPKGSRSVAYLPDGSTVWLNAGSEISYEVNYNETRKVKLIGEAFFKVKSDHKHPFVVSANGVAIKALGTSFNVKAYPEEKKVTTTLVEGIVNIERPGSSSSEHFVITLRPNQKVTVYNDSTLYFEDKSKLNSPIAIQKERAVAFGEKQLIPSIKAQNINTDLYTSWKDDRWIIDREDFGNLATLLERRYNVNISFSTNELKRYRFSGTFTNETIEQALSLMRYTLPFSYTIDRNSIVLKVDPLLMKSYNSAYEKNINKTE